jgi:multicomponent Na+:H+ antiporter subunit G
MHGSGVTDTLGAALLLMSWMLQPADCLVTVKLLSILILLYITSPTAGHALIHAAYTSGHMPKLADDAAQPPEVPKP